MSDNRTILGALNRLIALFQGKNGGAEVIISSSGSGSSSIEVLQDTHDDLNANVNLQIGDTDVSISNPIPVSSTVTARTQSNIVTGSNIGSVDNTLTNQGVSIDVTNVNSLGIYINYTANDSTGAELYIFAQHTSGGALYPLEELNDYKKNLGNNNITKFYPVNCEGMGYIQIQTLATDIDTGGGTVGTITIDITK